MQQVTRRRLNVVDPGDQLRGLGPPTFERLARTAQLGSAAHRGLVLTTATLAGQAVSTCIPPSGQADLLAALETARLWATGGAEPQAVKSARAQCFGAVTAIEDLTERAVGKAQSHFAQSASSPLDPHADHVLLRYARLSAHFAVSAVCHCLDTISEPGSSLEVLSDVQGARAYQLAGLGSARHPAFRQAAWKQAEWEASRAPDGDHKMLSVQVFHEYLGGRWRAHADAVEQEQEAFLNWALSADAART